MLRLVGSMGRPVEVVVDIADSVLASDVEHRVLINGHGGNYVLSNIVQEYRAAHGPVMSLFPEGPDWTAACLRADMETTSHDDMHAGELETSVLLQVAPETIRPGNDDRQCQESAQVTVRSVSFAGIVAALSYCKAK